MRGAVRRVLAISVMIQPVGHSVVGTSLAYDRGSREAIVAANAARWLWAGVPWWITRSPPAAVHGCLVCGLRIASRLSWRDASLTVAD